MAQIIPQVASRSIYFLLTKAPPSDCHVHAKPGRFSSSTLETSCPTPTTLGLKACMSYETWRPRERPNRVKRPEQAGRPRTDVPWEDHASFEVGAAEAYLKRNDARELPVVKCSNCEVVLRPFLSLASEMIKILPPSTKAWRQAHTGPVSVPRRLPLLLHCSAEAPRCDKCLRRAVATPCRRSATGAPAAVSTTWMRCLPSVPRPASVLETARRSNMKAAASLLNWPRMCDPQRSSSSAFSGTELPRPCTPSPGEEDCRRPRCLRAWVCREPLHPRTLTCPRPSKTASNSSTPRQGDRVRDSACKHCTIEH